MLVHNANGYGLFTGGLGFHQGAERLGATVVPVSGGFTERQVTLLHDLRAQVLFATPSYALHIGNALDEHGLGPDDLALEVGVFGGEPWTQAMGAAIERALGWRL
jgi:phenylacetate-CoA ligase